MSGKYSGCLKFNLKKDLNSISKMIVNIMNLDEKYILYDLDSATTFQASQILKNVSVETELNAIRLC